MALIKQILKKIEESQVVNEPYEHLIIDDLLPDDFYQQLARDLELEDFDKNYRRGDYGNKERFGVDITDYNSWTKSNKKNSTVYHADNFEALLSKGYEHTRRFFESCIESKDELYKALCRKLQTKKIDDNYFFHASMVKDSVGYTIERHTDNEENIFTILFYAPETDQNKDFGLHIYKDAETEFGAKCLEFLPNRMVIFAPCEPNKDRAATWHEVKRLSDKLVGTRNSFQMFFYKNR